MSDNGSAYCSHAWRDACADLGITHKRTRPYRPQTNGKIERFHRTLADGWAYAPYPMGRTSVTNVRGIETNPADDRCLAAVLPNSSGSGSRIRFWDAGAGRRRV